VSNSHGAYALRVDRDDGIVDAFARLTERRGTDSLVVAPGGRATFSDVDALARAAAARIAAAPIESASLLGLAAPNGPAFLAGFLAIRRAGHAALLLDHTAPLDEVRRVLGALGASGLLACDRAWPTSDRDLRLSEVAATAP